MSIILYAIPVFFVLIAAELIAEKIRGTHYYRTNDAITSLSVGVLSRVTGVLKSIVPLTIYVLVFEHLALFEIPTLWWTWMLIFIAYDFLYYWNHRFGHEISLFWAAHVVHHSSEDYNLTTALRQSSGSFFNFIFFIPLAILGVDPLIFISVASANLVYQFWVHTQHIKKIGISELFMVTPSNHRVHHAQNLRYLDRNYGGVFIVWDRVFGTYQDELDQEVPVYGVRKALNSWNPLYANIQVYSQLIKDSVRTKKWSDKIRVWFGRTGWRPLDVATKYPLAKSDLRTFKPYDVAISWPKKIYCILHYAVMAALGLYLMTNVSALSLVVQVMIASLLVGASINLAWILEGRTIATYLEAAKSVAIVIGATVLGIPIEFAIGYFTVSMLSLTLLKSPHAEVSMN